MHLEAAAISAAATIVWTFVKQFIYVFNINLNSVSVLKIHVNATMQLGALLTGSAQCSPVPMFTGTYVPRTYVPRYLCSPVLMFPDVVTLIVDFSTNS